MTDVIVAIEIIGYVQRITSKTSTMLFNKVLHQKVFIMSFKTERIKRTEEKTSHMFKKTSKTNLGNLITK